jgi:hypothetical protein
MGIKNKEMKYKNIDVAETLPTMTGKWIKKNQRWRSRI